MGRVRAPFGVKGWVKVEPYTETVESLLAYPEWWLANSEGWEPRQVSEAARHGAHLVVRFEGCEDRDAAGSFTNRDIGIPRRQLPDVPGQYYWSDLIGLEVVNRDGQLLGRVDRLMETGANAVLACRFEAGAERLLPFVEGVVLSVDPKAGRIVVDWGTDY